jgi:hypothetical protein
MHILYFLLAIISFFVTLIIISVLVDVMFRFILILKYKKYKEASLKVNEFKIRNKSIYDFMNGTVSIVIMYMIVKLIFNIFGDM